MFFRTSGVIFTWILRRHHNKVKKSRTQSIILIQEMHTYGHGYCLMDTIFGQWDISLSPKMIRLKKKKNVFIQQVLRLTPLTLFGIPNRLPVMLSLNENLNGTVSLHLVDYQTWDWSPTIDYFIMQIRDGAIRGQRLQNASRRLIDSPFARIPLRGLIVPPSPRLCYTHRRSARAGSHPLIPSTSCPLSHPLPHPSP